MALNFPAKIYQILENESTDVIRWHPNGCAFRIMDHGRFEREIIPKYFRHNQISSVQRQLNLYGFKCISRGEDKGAFFHPKFKKGDWDIVKKITRYAPSALPTPLGKKDDSPSMSMMDKDGKDMMAENPFMTSMYNQGNVFYGYSAEPVNNWQWTDSYNFMNMNSMVAATAPMDMQVNAVYNPSAMVMPASSNSSTSTEFASIATDTSVPQNMQRIEVKSEAQPYVHVVNDVVTVDPYFDLDAELEMFHQVGLHSITMPHYTMSAAAVSTTKNCRDVGVNTDLSQISGLLDMYSSCYDFAAEANGI